MNFFHFFIWIFVFDLTKQSEFFHYCQINSQVYISSYFRLLIINDLNQISQIKVNSTCFKNFTFLRNINVRDKKYSLNTKFDWYNLLKLNYAIQKIPPVYVNFIEIRSFIIEENSTYDSSINIAGIRLKFFYTKFIFTYKNKVVKSCEQIKNIQVHSFFNQVRIAWLLLDNSFMSDKICPLIFHNVFVQIVLLMRVVNTFYSKKNKIIFFYF